MDTKTETISLAALKKAIACPGREHLAIQYLIAHTYVSSGKVPRGKPRRFMVIRELPTPEALAEMLRVRHTATVIDRVNSAVGELEVLKEELQEWYDSLPENFQNGEKGDELQTAVQALEEMEEHSFENTEPLAKLEVVHYPGDGLTSRAARAAEACRELEAVKDALEAARDDLAEDTDEYERAQELIEWCDNTVSAAESVEFPGR